ncbi:MAG: site-specific DNA-methyltransferase [Chloroflexi bacterium]|nr:site-specific DNA-methyltransferase [Chloroflexota bacterium]
MASVSKEEKWEQLGLLTPLADEPLPNNGAIAFRDPAFAANKALPVHRWVPWIAGFSRTFVQDAIKRHLDQPGVVLDPFAGVGTTLLEAIRSGHRAIGFEINPYAALACRTKLNAYQIEVAALNRGIARLVSFWQESISSGYTPRSAPPKGFHTRVAFYSPKVLRKALIIQDFMEMIEDQRLRDLFRIAFASTMVRYSNYSYEPSLGTRAGAGKEEIEDFAVLETVAGKLSEMAEDIAWLQSSLPNGQPEVEVIHDSFLHHSKYVAQDSVDLLITSPPYLNNYHYTRNTRPQIYWLGLAEGPRNFTELEEMNFGKFWQTVRERPRVDLSFGLPGSDLAERIETIRDLHPERGVYGGSGWANYAASYFNDCYRFSLGMRNVLRSGGTALVVIGNSILQGVLIPTDQYLGQIAASIGLELVEIHVPRATRVGNSIIQSDIRVAKAHKSHHLYEAVVELRKK